jgi:hypothetical protein
MITPLVIRRDALQDNIPVRPVTVGRPRKEKHMSSLVEDLTRDRMRRVQHDAELGRMAERRRREQRRSRSEQK